MPVDKLEGLYRIIREELSTFMERSLHEMLQPIIKKKEPLQKINQQPIVPPQQEVRLRQAEPSTCSDVRGQ